MPVCSCSVTVENGVQVVRVCHDHGILIDDAVSKERERCAKLVEEYRGDTIMAKMIRGLQQ